MRLSKWSLASAVAAGLLIPFAAQAQLTSCEATVVNPNPTCSLNKNASTTVNQVLTLTIKSVAINLQATDSVAYEKTFQANGSQAGTTGTAVTTAATLQDADVADSVIVLANRPFTATVKAQDALFTFEKDGTYNTCRTSGAGSASCSGVQTLAGKPAGDVYLQINSVTFDGSNAGAGSLSSGGTWHQLSSSTPLALITSTTSGARAAAQIKVKSAWFYATDIPGSYTATMVYTVTGN